MQVRRDILGRIYIAFGCVVLVALLLVGQAFRLQFVEGSKWKDLADSLTSQYRMIHAERGNIYAIDGRLMATSLPSFDVRIDLKAPALQQKPFAQLDSLATALAGLRGSRNSEEIRQRLYREYRRGNRYYRICRALNYVELETVKQFPVLRQGRFKGGLIVEGRYRRTLPYDPLANRSIGYVRQTLGAQSVGLEAAFDEELKGQDGMRLMQKIAGGTWRPVNDRNEIEPHNGYDLHTTVDLGLQDIVHHALDTALKASQAKRGCAVLMDVRTGAIRAIANLTRSEDGSYAETYNMAVGASMEPGSTFKPFTLLALLEDGLISPDDSVDVGNGTARFCNTDMNDVHFHGRVLSVSEALAYSSNVAIARLASNAYSEKPEDMVRYWDRLGLSKPTGIEIPGEGRSYIQRPEGTDWSCASLSRLSIGYGMEMTPIQILTFYNGIANHGMMMKPHLVSGVKSYGKTIKKFEPQVLNQRICSKETRQALHDMLCAAASHGTAHRLNAEGYDFAGKTGTTLIVEDGAYLKRYRASFVGYFPAEDPLYSCIVVIEAPKGSYYGSTVAGPVFQDIANRVYASRVAMEEADAIPQPAQAYRASAKGHAVDLSTLANAVLHYEAPEADDADWMKIELNGDSVQGAALAMDARKVPDVRGMGLRDALYLLEVRGLKVTVHGAGRVRRQSIRYGTDVVAGASIEIWLK